MRDISISLNDPYRMRECMTGDAIPIFEKLKRRGLYDYSG